MKNIANKISDAELEVMKVVWQLEPVTFAQVRDNLIIKPNWTSPTVNTLMNRLVKKGVLVQEQKEVYYYSATITEAEYARDATNSFLDKVYSGNIKGLLSTLINNNSLTSDDLKELDEFWEKGGDE